MTSQGMVVSRWMRLTLDGSWKPIGEGATQSRAARYSVRDSLTNEPYEDSGALKTGCGEWDSLQTPFSN
jgi:hypothetical protein